MLEILRNPQNNMQEVLNAFPKKITTIFQNNNELEERVSEKETAPETAVQHNAGHSTVVSSADDAKSC